MTITPAHLAHLPLRIQQARVRANLKPQQLAHLIGISDSIVRRWETGYARPSIDTITALALATDTDLHWLITGNPYRARTALPQHDH